MTAETEEVKKDSKHTAKIFPGLDKYDFFTQEEKDKLEILVRDKILEISKSRYDYELIVTLGKQSPKLEDEQEQSKRDKRIDQQVKVIEMFTKDLETWENILKKIDNDT